MRATMYRHDHQRGAVAVIVAIVATLLIACMAFAIDLGYAWQVRRSMVKATDASALAAAHTQSALGTPTTGDCPTSVRTTATAYLSGNASNTTMDFCVVTGGAGDDDDTSAGSTLGTLTVRGVTEAQFSFAKLFGLNATTVHSSTTVAWSQAPLVPLMACVSTNAQPSQWFADSSSNRAPVQVAQQWSGSTSSDPCSSGKSDSYALVDFSTVPTSTSDARSCTSQPATLATSLVDWLTNGYNGTISVGSYRCARVGQPYGTAVDQAICALRGRQAVVPLIDVVDKQEIPGTGKADLVRVAGFATVTVDDYTPLDGSNQCDTQFPSLAGPTASQRPTASTRDRTRRRNIAPRAVPIAARRAAVNGDVAISQSGTWPQTVTLDTPTNLTLNVTNSTNSALNDLVVRLQFTVTVATPQGCTSITGGYECPLATTPKNGTANLVFTLPTSQLGPVTVNARVSSSSTNDSNPTNNVTSKTITVVTPSTTTSSTSSTTSSTTTTAPPTTTSTTIDPHTYRILTMTFQESMASGACCNGLDHLYSYTICDVDLSTRAAALNPPNCQMGADDGDGDSDRAAALARGTTRDLTRTRLIGTHRRSTARVRPSIPHSPTTGRNPT